MFTHLGRFIPPELERFDNQGKRWYRDKANTFAYPSVTTVLDVNKPDGLKKWQLSVGLDKAAKMAKEAAERGTAVHDLAERYLLNEDLESEKIPLMHNHLFKQFKFVGRKINNIDGLEIPLYSHVLRASGTTDCIGEYDGVPSVIDFKTSRNIKTKDMIENYFLQCTAYAVMFNELFDQAIDQIVIIMVVENGFQPIVFKESIHKYVEPLLNVIDRYYSTLRPV